MMRRSLWWWGACGVVTLVFGGGLLFLAGGAAPTIRPERIPVPPPQLGADGCPSGAEQSGLGPEMKRLPEGFCIDVTEVTRSQYQAWLDGSPTTDDQPESCADNDDFTPRCAWPAGGSDGGHPVVCVDWCDARAFCEAAGKRLCGDVDGGRAYPFEDYANPTVSEWYAACSSGGAHDYAHGDATDSAACRSGDAEDYTTWGQGDTGSFTDCQSPEADYAGVFDLSGNAAEWDNSCTGDGPDDACRFRGGSFQHQGIGLRCDSAKNLKWPRMNAVQAIGFRCCAD